MSTVSRGASTGIPEARGETPRGTWMGEAGIEPFFFGLEDERLYGCIDRPQGGMGERGVVICPPMGPEYVGCHRGLRQLAKGLAQRGFPAMRFDYLGTGDSAGESRDASLGRMERDLKAAIDAFRERARCRSLALVGQRLGASLLLRADLSREAVSRFVLWDPVLRGAGFLEEIRGGSRSPRRGRDERSGVEQKGFWWTDVFLDELAAMDLTHPTAAAGARTLIVETRPGGEGAALAEGYRGRGVDADHALLETPPLEEGEIDRISVPVKVIQRIVTWMAKEAF